MAKYKNTTAQTLRFDFQNAEKVIIANQVLEIPETNSYIDGLIELGILEEVPNPKTTEK